MDSARELSLRFLETHPEGAVSVLESIAPEDAAAFLKGVPDDVAGRVLERMQPLLAAAILPTMTRKKAGAVLLAMDVHGRSRILRVLDEGLKNSIMAELPKGAARDLKRFLQYPEGSAGAWMSSDVAVFEKATTVKDCLVQLRTLPEKVRSLIFVVDEQKKLYGSIDLADLFSVPEDSTVDKAATTGIKRLSPLARLISIVALPAWDTALSLPVVDSKGRLLGALHFDRLREGLVSEQRATTDEPLGRILAHLAEAFLACAAGFLHLPSAKPTLSRPIGEEED